MIHQNNAKNKQNAEDNKKNTKVQISLLVLPKMLREEEKKMKTRTLPYTTTIIKARQKRYNAHSYHKTQKRYYYLNQL